MSFKDFVMSHSLFRALVIGSLSLFCLSETLLGQVTTSGYSNIARSEAPGTLLSHPLDNGSEPIGRTTSLNYLNGWVIVGGEIPGSRDLGAEDGSDLLMRVYDISNPAAPVRRTPTDFNLSYPGNRWHEGNVGWNAHGTAQFGNLLLPQVIRVEEFGGLVELGGTNGIPTSRSGRSWLQSFGSQAGPWLASLQWYGTDDDDFVIHRT